MKNNKQRLRRIRVKKYLYLDNLLNIDGLNFEESEEYYKLEKMFLSEIIKLKYSKYLYKLLRK
jgi:hypothetical protein